MAAKRSRNHFLFLPRVERLVLPESVVQDARIELYRFISSSSNNSHALTSDTCFLRTEEANFFALTCTIFITMTARSENGLPYRRRSLSADGILNCT